MPRRPRAAAVTAAAVLIAAALLAACSSSSDDATTKAASGSTTTTTAGAGGGSTTTAAVAPGDPVPSAGCGTTKVRSVVAERQYLDDSDRWWLLTTPLEHDGATPIPLVLDFHGLMEGAEVHSKMTGFGEFALDHGFAVAMPQGSGTPIHWAVNPDPATNEDLAYAAGMLDQLEASLCIDTSRVYATGLSNGAFFSSVLACTMADRFAAVAPVAGIIHPGGCEPSRPVPILAFHGTEDPILLFNGGVGPRLGNIISGNTDDEPPLPKADLNGPGYPASAQEWAETDGCDPTPTESKVTDTITERRWSCPAGVEVLFDIIAGGGHSWPGSAFSEKAGKLVGATDMSIDADQVIWDFFQRHRLPD
jgi:polyhydroxybutyrate depolymerase